MIDEKPPTLSTHHCPLCGYATTRPFLIGRPDFEYGVDFKLHYAICQNPKCGLVYAVNIPALDVVRGFYLNYSTHRLYHPSKIGSMVSFLSSMNRRGYLKSVFACRDLESLRVLDYGCGSGDFMRDLIHHGVKGVYGYDFDPEACRCAQELGLKACSTETVFKAEGPYDYVFLNHVIEHLAHPEATLGVLIGSLKNGGRLVVRTPNARSLLAKLFGDNWRGWETPRHFHVFNTNSARNLVRKIGDPRVGLVDVGTSNAMIFGMFHESFHSQFWRSSLVGKMVRHTLAAALFPIALLYNEFRRDTGEELVFTIELFDGNGLHVSG